MWLENEFKKGSNQISSALYHRLLNTDLSGVHTIKVVVDGCGGQNKNKIVIDILSKFLSQDSSPPSAKRKTLLSQSLATPLFPPIGVLNELSLQKKVKNTTLLIDKGNVKIFKLFISQTVIHLVDWKEATSETIKEPKDWHFKLRPTKRIVMVKTKKKEAVL